MAFKETYAKGLGEAAITGELLLSLYKAHPDGAAIFAATKTDIERRLEAGGYNNIDGYREGAAKQLEWFASQLQGKG